MGRRPEPTPPWVSGLLWGIVFTLLILWLAGCKSTSMSEQDAKAIGYRVAEVARIGGLPLANIAYTTDGTFGGTYSEPKAAETQCETYTITLNYQFAASHTNWVMENVIPHEYAHLASCYHRGGMGDPALMENGDPHDAFWAEWVIKLGGNPEYI